MAGVPKVARCIHCCPNIFISSSHSASLYCDEHVYIHIYLTV